MWIYVFISFECIPWSTVARFYKVTPCLTEKVPNFSQSLPFYMPTSKVREFQHLPLIYLFITGHPSGCEVVSYYGFDLMIKLNDG